MEHVYAIGQSGSGKSTLLRNRMLSNIYDGLGVFYFDPHGADTDTLLPLIPRDRANEVILFDPSDAEHPIPLNALEFNGHIAVVTSAIERAIKDNIGYADTSTPTMSLYIRNTIMALLEAGEPMTGMSFMLTSARYREKVLKRVRDPLINRFWSDFDILTTKEKRQEVASTYNKTFAMILDKRIRNIIGQRKSTFFPREVLDGKIVLARMPQGRLGFEQVRMLGILLLSQIHLAAMAKPATVPAHLYLDEVHTLDGGTLREMLTGIRKYGVSIASAHQHLDQISPELQAALLGNCTERYVFRVSKRDAEVLNDHEGPDNVNTDLHRLPPFEARLFHTTYRPRKFTVEHENWPIDEKVPRIVRSNMYRNYARSEHVVHAEIDRFIEDA